MALCVLIYFYHKVRREYDMKTCQEKNVFCLGGDSEGVLLQTEMEFPGGNPLRCTYNGEETNEKHLYSNDLETV
ncbi:MAG: hypothetical protein HW390_1285 [Candidatus Brocadiaceae bacterium]|nr:hypothetical protein [Candidatus Brocadiaceae bacterium]